MINRIIAYLKKIRSSKTSKIWLMSYIFILLVPIIFSFLSYYYMENNLAQKINETNINALESSQTFLDGILGSIINATAALSSNEEISDLAANNIPLSAERKYELANSNYVWNAHQIFTEYILNKCIYFPDTDTVYTGKAIIPCHYYFLSAYQDRDSFDEALWKQEVLMKNIPDFVSVSAKNDTKIFYVFPAYNFTRDSVRYNTIVEIDYKKLINDAGGTGKNALFMYSSGGNTVLSEDLNNEYVSSINKCMESDSKFNCVTSKEEGDLIVLKSESSVSSWTYGTITKENEYWSDLFAARAFMWCFSILGIILGLVIIIYLVLKNSKPLEAIINTLAPNSSEDSGKDTYEYINSIIKKTINEKEIYFDRLYKQNDMLKQTVLLNILHGKKNEKFSYEDQLYMVGINMENTMFAAVTLYTEDLSGLFFNDGYETTESERQKLSSLIMSNILGEAISEKYKCETVTTGNFVVAIVNFDDTQAVDFKNTLTKILTDSFAIINKEFNFKVMGAVSDSHVTLNRLNDAYNESVLCMEYAILKESVILFYDEISSADIKSDNPYMLDCEDEIAKCLENREFKKCKKIIENLIYKFQLNKNVSLEFARTYAFDLLSTFFKHIVSNSNDKSRKFLANVEMNSIMTNCPTVSSVMLKTLTIIDKYLEEIDYDTDDKPDKRNFYQQIKDYIDSHYSDTTLCVSEISMIFKTNSSYLSSQFKKEFDIGLLDYITSVRIDAAKKLLVTTDESNTEISLQVGYTNTRTFLRAFSKLEGITPKEYRRLNNPAV